MPKSKIVKKEKSKKKSTSSAGLGSSSKKSTAKSTAKKSAQVNIKYVHMAPRKIRRVANLVRSLSVIDAENLLNNLPKRAAQPVSKAMKSAKANAVQNHQMDEKKLFVESIAVDESLTLSRFRPRAQGRAFPIRKRFAHINIRLSEQPTEKTAKIAPRRDNKVLKKSSQGTPAKSKTIKQVKPVISATKMK